MDNSRRACGEHDGLTREVQGLYSVVQRLEQEAAAPDSLLNQNDEDRKVDLEGSIENCRKHLGILDSVLKKYNALSEEERASKRLWSQIKFGNGEMLDLSELRLKLLTCTSAITLHLNLISFGSQGRVERQLNKELPEIRRSLDEIVAKRCAGHEGSVLTTYAGDDKVVWKELRRELVGDGCSSSLIRLHKDLIMSSIKELGERGALDEPQPLDPSSPDANLELPFNSGTLVHDGDLPSYQSATSQKGRPSEEIESAALTESENQQCGADTQARARGEQSRKAGEQQMDADEELKREDSDTVQASSHNFALTEAILKSQFGNLDPGSATKAESLIVMGPDYYFTSNRCGNDSEDPSSAKHLDHQTSSDLGEQRQAANTLPGHNICSVTGSLGMNMGIAYRHVCLSLSCREIWLI